MKISLFSILLLFILYSCKDGGNTVKKIEYSKNYKGYTIDVNSIHTPENFRDIIDEIEFIPLQTNDNSFITRPDKVISYKNLFYILDSQYSSLKVFDEKGKYIRSIGNMGHGPGEFTTLSDFNILPQDEKILILSHNEQSIIEYDLEGNYIKTIRSGLNASSFAKIDDMSCYYIDHHDNDLSKNYNLIIMDSIGKIENRLFPFPKTLEPLYDSGVILKNNEGALYNSALSDTIFQLTENNEIYPKYIFDFGKNALPLEARNSLNKLKEVELKHSYLFKQFVESEDVLAFTYWEKSKRISAFCHKESDMEENGKNLLTPIKLDFPITFGLTVGLTEDNEIISYIEISWFLNWLDEGKISKVDLKKDYPELYDLTLTLELTDNPILIVYKMK